MLSLPDYFWISVLSLLVLSQLLFVLIAILASSWTRAVLGILGGGLIVFMIVHVSRLNSGKAIEFAISGVILFDLLVFTKSSLRKLEHDIFAKDVGIVPSNEESSNPDGT